MECKECKNTLSINKAENVLKDNKLYRKLTFKCRNPNCINYEKEVESVYNELEVIKE